MARDRIRLRDLGRYYKRLLVQILIDAWGIIAAPGGILAGVVIALIAAAAAYEMSDENLDWTPVMAGLIGVGGYGVLLLGWRLATASFRDRLALEAALPKGGRLVVSMVSEPSATPSWIYEFRPMSISSVEARVESQLVSVGGKRHGSDGSSVLDQPEGRQIETDRERHEDHDLAEAVPTQVPSDLILCA